MSNIEDYKAEVEKRVAKEKAEREVKESRKTKKISSKKNTSNSFENIHKEIEQRMLEISNEDILAYLTESTLGDAKLFQRLHNDMIVFVKYWNRFLLWSGHHWVEDDYNSSFSYIENVCATYLRLAEAKRDELEDTKDKDLSGLLEQIINSIEKRVKLVLNQRQGQSRLGKIF